MCDCPDSSIKTEREREGGGDCIVLGFPGHAWLMAASAGRGGGRRSVAFVSVSDTELSCKQGNDASLLSDVLRLLARSNGSNQDCSEPPVVWQHACYLMRERPIHFIWRVSLLMVHVYIYV